MLESDAEAMLREWAEAVTYTPREGAARQILAIPNREEPAVLEGPAEGAVRPRMTVEVANRATSVGDDGFGGVSSAEVDTGGDTMTVSERLGKAARVMRVVSIEDQDEAMMTLGLR